MKLKNSLHRIACIRVYQDAHVIQKLSPEAFSFEKRRTETRHE